MSVYTEHYEKRYVMKHGFTYSNPVAPDVITAIRDPFIMLDGGNYYPPVRHLRSGAERTTA